MLRMRVQDALLGEGLSFVWSICFRLVNTRSTDSPRRNPRRHLSHHASSMLGMDDCSNGCPCLLCNRAVTCGQSFRYWRADQKSAGCSICRGTESLHRDATGEKDKRAF